MTRHSGTEPDGAETGVDAPDAPLDLSGATLRALLELVPVGVLVWHDERLFTNRRGAELTGLPPTGDARAYTAPEDMPFTFTLGGRELSFEEEPLRRALAHGAVTRDAALRLARADGTGSDVTLSAWPITDAEGTPRGAVAALAEASASPPEETMQRVEHLASLGTLAASVAHEINNPLNSIMVNAELALIALDKSTDRGKVRHALETIIRDVKRCGSITHGVLQLSKANDTHREPHDPNDVVRQARQLVAAYFRMHDAILELDLEELPPVRMNATIMEHAVVNLLRNAAEAGGKGVRVRLGTRHTGDTVVITVSDDGPGIAAEHLDKVFKPLFSTNRHRDGTGLGLSLVHRTIKEHGGTIRVQSRPNAGTTFTIELPVAQAQSSDDGAHPDR